MTAQLNSYRQSPRKVRLVVDAVRGKMLGEAMANLLFIPKRAAEPILKLLKSAAANAKTVNGLEPENLLVKEIAVDKGATMYRSMPRARGTSYQIRKRTSHVFIKLGTPVAKKEAKNKKK